MPLPVNHIFVFSVFDHAAQSQVQGGFASWSLNKWAVGVKGQDSDSDLMTSEQ